MTGWLIQAGRVLGLITEKGAVRATFAPGLPPPLAHGFVPRAPPPPLAEQGGASKRKEADPHAARRWKASPPPSPAAAAQDPAPAPPRGQLGLF